MTELILPVFYAILQLITFFVIGFFLRKKNLFQPEFFKQTSSFVVRIGLPIYYFVRMAMVDITQITSALFFPIASILLVFTTLMVSMMVMDILHIKGPQKRVGMALGTFGNSSFLPLFMIELFPLSVPSIEAIFGISTPLLYLGAFTIMQSPLLWGVGNYLVSGKMGRPALRERKFGIPIYAARMM
jgi:predicted permease